METYQLLAPRIEAVGLPTLLKRATTTPRRYVLNQSLHTLDSKSEQMYKQSVDYIPMDVYRCLCSLTRYESFLRFRYVKNKARDIRLFHIWCPTSASKTLLFGFSQRFLHHFRREDIAKIHFFFETTNNRGNFSYKSARNLLEHPSEPSAEWSLFQLC